MVRAASEEGFLSLAFDPEFQRNLVYTYYRASNPRRTVLSRFEVRTMLPTRERTGLLEMVQPFKNHKGGAIRFGPDGMLYLGWAMAAAGDPSGNGQNLGALLAERCCASMYARQAISRSRTADNPSSGREASRPEIWGHPGLRNPWRHERSKLRPASSGWGTSVQGTVEEVDIVERGANYGWNRLEGNELPRATLGCDRAGIIHRSRPTAHDDGCSITGGAVYRGSRSPRLRPLPLRRLLQRPGLGAQRRRRQPVMVAGTMDRHMSSFATDEAGEEVYLVVHGGPVLRIAAPNRRPVAPACETRSSR